MYYYNHVRPDLKDFELKQVNENGTRYYQTTEGSKYPSVTTVLSEYSKQGIKQWRTKVGDTVANEISNRASGRGTRIHKLCEDYIDNKEVEYKNVFDRIMFESMKPLLHKIDNVHAQEHRMFSDHLRMAGTADCIAEYEGRLSIIDFKTASKSKRPEWIENYFMQCSAYAVMYEELHKEPIDKIVVIIGVDDDDPQVFVEKRDNWTGKLIQYRDLFESNQKSVDLVL